MRESNQRSHHMDAPWLPAATALFLDFDGTLAELTARPGDVVVPDDLPALLMALHNHFDGAVGIVTGRRLEDIDRRLAPVRLAGAGLHGAELRTLAEGDIRRVGETDRLQPIIAKLRARFGDDPRILVEDKGAGVSLHFRLAPDRAAECRQVMREAATSPSLKIIDGNAVVEALPAGVDKGRAMRILLGVEPFRGRQPVFVGDDRTDEDGFAAVAACGGFGVKVGTGDTIAPYRLAGVGAVYAWLHASLHACE